MLSGFGPFEVDFDRFELRRQGERLVLPRSAFDLLAFLIERRAVVCKEDELADALGFAPEVLTDSVTSLRRALDDEAEPAQWIQVIAGRGYRFIGTIALRTPPPRSSWPAPGQERPHFVGRAVPLRILVRACAGGPSIVLVAGEAGMGKSRLVAEALSRAPERDRVVVVEDIDRMDGTALDGVKVKAVEAARRGTTLIVTLRPSHEPAVVETEEALRGYPFMQAVELSPLTREDTFAFATAMAGRPLSETILEQVYRKTEGHPLRLSALSHVFDPYR